MSNSRYTIHPQDFQKLSARLLYISTSKYEGDWQSIPHTHHFAELIYVLDGQGRFYMENSISPISAGALIIVPPNVEHTEKSYPSHPLEYIVLGIDGITFQNESESDGRLIFSYGKRTDILDILRLLLEEAKEEKEGRSLACQDLLEVLLIRIFRAQKLIPTPYAATKMTKECGIVRRYLDSNYADSITLESLASLAHMNKYYLVHAFTKYTGLSPINYLNTKRLEISRELLTGTNHSIAQIASLVGFSSQSYFAQSFKKETGISPAQYRKEHGNISPDSHAGK